MSLRNQEKVSEARMKDEPMPEEALEGFGARLAQLIAREPGRAKQRAFAKKIGVKPQQLSRYLKGQIPDPPTLLRIAKVAEVSTDWLLGLEHSSEQE